MPRDRKHPQPPEWLSKRQAPVKGDSPWWRQVAQELLTRPGLVGQEVTIEELSEMVPEYPDGRRARTRAVARRLKPILQLVSRGPNGSLGRGAVYRIVRPPEERTPVEHPLVDEEWLLEAAARMAGKK